VSAYVPDLKAIIMNIIRRLILTLLAPCFGTAMMMIPLKETKTPRRRFLASAAASAFGVTIQPVLPPPAGAVKERNEALCNTGFFTNIAQYRCTPVGNIWDEGQKTSLSVEEEGATNSLLSKFNFETSESSSDEKDDGIGVTSQPSVDSRKSAANVLR